MTKILHFKGNKDMPGVASGRYIYTLQVTEAMLDVIKPAPQLRSLHLGHMRLQPERLAGLTSHGALQELTIHGEELSTEARNAIQHLTQLTALGMTCCYQASTFQSLLLI